MKNMVKLIGIIAFAALIGFSFIACDDGGGTGSSYYDGGGGGGGTVSGTYYLFTDWYITFNNGNYTGYDGDLTRGTYRVSGSTITLSPSFYGSTWTIIDSNTVRDRDGDRWRKR